MPDHIKKITYKVGNDKFDIDPSQKDEFLKDFPNAQELLSFKVDKDTFDIEPSQRDEFLRDFPNAVPTFAEGEKKNPVGSFSQSGSQGLQGGTPSAQRPIPSKPLAGLGGENVITPRLITEPKPLAQYKPIKQLPTGEKFVEKDFFGGNFGAMLKSIDAATPLGLGEFIDDIGRSISSGYKQGQSTDETLLIMAKGRNINENDLQKYMDAVKVAQNQPMSDAMYNFNKSVEEKAAKNEGGKADFWDVFTSLNAGVVPEIVLSSFSAMLNPASATAAGGAVAGGAVVGGAVGAVASAPLALAAAGTTLETASTFNELLQKELENDGKEFTKDNVRTILEDPKRLSQIRSKAAGRGLTIGVVDAITGKLGGAIGAKIAKSGAKGATTLGALATTGTEAIGGSAGEAAGQVVAGQEISPQDIVLEGIGEIGTAPIQFASAIGSDMSSSEILSAIRSEREKKKQIDNISGRPSYEINGETVSKETVDEIIDNMPVGGMDGLSVIVDNDRETSDKVASAMKRSEVESNIKKAAPSLSEENVSSIAELQVELDALKGNDTEVAKKRASEIRSKIDVLIGEKPQIAPPKTEATPTEEQVAPTAETTPPQETPVSESETNKIPAKEGTLAASFDNSEDISDVVENGTKVTVGDTEMVLIDKGNSVVELNKIRTPKGKRGKGSARKALQELTAKADEQGITLELNVAPEKGTTKEGLVKLYESQGFVADKGDMMRREPKKIETPKNLKGLLDVMSGIFNLNKPQAESASVIGDIMVGNMAKRAGITKTEMYGRLEFKKASEKDLPQGVKMQVDAWHGSPYQFDKFTTEKIGTGEGAQAFGWGLYFTDLESIARDYADKLTEHSVYINGEEVTSLKGTPLYDVSLFIFGSNNIAKEQGKQSAIANLEQAIRDNRIDYNEAKKAIEYLKGLDSFSVKKDKRNLYKVSLHKGKTPDQYTWLEWDKPLTEKQIDKIKKQAKTENVDISNVDFEGDTKNIYNQLGQHWYFNGIKNHPKEVSLFLLRAGIDGIKYPAESISRGATSDTARGFNYVVFDENAVSIEEVIKFQKDAEKARGAMMMTMDNNAIIYALTDPNISTPLHELAHVYEHYLTDAERKEIQNWAGTPEWTIETSEKFARGFEKYLSEGKSPVPQLQKYFDNFKNWLLEIYNGIVGSDIDIELNAPMRKIYDRMTTPTTNPQSVESETEGLTNKQATKKGVEELLIPKTETNAKEQESILKSSKSNYEFVSLYDAVKRGNVKEYIRLLEKKGIVKIKC